MPFRRIQTEHKADSIVRQIEKLILAGVLHPGERLPAERDLAERMGVSRPSLRQALAELERRDLLVSRPGSGVYVAEVLGSAFAPPLVRLFATHDEALFDYLAFRRDLEGLAAERAARQGSDTDLAVVDSIFRRMEEAAGANDPKAEARLDAEFHLAIIEAAHNVIMVHMMRSMFDLLQQGVFYNRRIMFERRTSRKAMLDQHRAINDALQARDAAGARAAVEAHLGFIEQAMLDRRKALRNEELARMRFERLAERDRKGG